MCGIFGWITPGRIIDRKRAAEAVSLMRHRGPDDEGYLFSVTGRGETALAGGDETSPELQLPTWRGEAVLPQADAVRIEELINYFEYDYSPPGCWEQHGHHRRPVKGCCYERVLG